MKPPSVVRAEASDACVARFADRPMKWGAVDCWQITGHNLRTLGISTSIAKGIRYSSEIGAAKALRSLGFKTLTEYMDAFDVFRIPPAMATQADVIGFECPGELWDVALAVCTGNGNVLGIGEAYGRALVMTPDLAAARVAWRCNPCRR